jgi:hypothetical protein
MFKIRKLPVKLVVRPNLDHENANTGHTLWLRHTMKTPANTSIHSVCAEKKFMIKKFMTELVLFKKISLTIMLNKKSVVLSYFLNGSLCYQFFISFCFLFNLTSQRAREYQINDS